jgi:hypothetical protein
LETKHAQIVEALTSTVDSSGSGDSNATERRDKAGLERTLGQIRAELYRQDSTHLLAQRMVTRTTPRYL